MKFVTNNALETIELGNKIGSLLKPGDVILLDGDLSAGKTTFTKGIGQGLGVKRVINSPTFTIVKEYIGKYKLYHMDLYRLDGLGNDFDLYEYFESDGVCIVEWPYQVSELLPKEFLKIKINRVNETEREFEFEYSGNRYKELLGEIECIH
jgi:tRNA threonylcarbamoyladenosine biosynthesis protein TsaE